MSVYFVDLVLAVWLFVSAFTLGHSPLSAALVAIAAVVVAALARLAVARPVLRFVITGITLTLAVLAVVLPGLGAWARVNTAVVALVLMALSAIRPVHGGLPGAPRAAGPGGPQPPQAD